MEVLNDEKKNIMLSQIEDKFYDYMGPHLSASTLFDKVGLLAFKTSAYGILGER